MNRATQVFRACLVVLIVVRAGAASAQVLEPITFKADFPFMAGNAMLPADAYRIEPVDNDPLLLHITSETRGANAFIEVENAIAPEAMKKTEVVFTFLVPVGSPIRTDLPDPGTCRF